MGSPGRVFLIRGIKPGIWGSSETTIRSIRKCIIKERTDESDINTTFGEGTALSGPSETVLENPSVESGFGLRSQPQVWIRNTLEDVVVVFRCPEDGRAWVRNIPGDGGKGLDHRVKKSVMYTKQHRHPERTGT